MSPFALVLLLFGGLLTGMIAGRMLSNQSEYLGKVVPHMAILLALLAALTLGPDGHFMVATFAFVAAFSSAAWTQNSAHRRAPRRSLPTGSTPATRLARNFESPRLTPADNPFERRDPPGQTIQPVAKPVGYRRGNLTLVSVSDSPRRSATRPPDLKGVS